MRKDSYDNFDKFADDYRQIHNQNIKISGADSDYFSEYKVKEIARFSDTIQTQTILDLGCGDGNSSFFFSKHFPNAAIHGIDISEASIEVADSRNINNALFRVYDGAYIPFPDNTFNICLIATVLHHIDHDKHPALMAEVYRCLKPGGKIYIFEHNPYNPVTRKVVNECVFDADAVLLTPGFAKKIVKEAGFRNTENNFTIFFPRSPLFRPLLPLESFLRKIPLGGQYYTVGTK
jgi:ubiquinone/menaquinone biosynthesis C-methylase UbiE